MNQRYPMTSDEEKSIRDKLHNLLAYERPKVIKAIAEARGHGDLKENAEYIAAKEQQTIIEERISELERQLAFAEIIDLHAVKNNGKVVFGATVTLINLDNGDVTKYTIVGDEAANPRLSRISVHSPLAKAVIGRSQGDEIEVKAPKGMISYKIESISFAEDNEEVS